jgi:hypothetical protein
MSTILVDAYGRPLVADPVGPMYGPMRFEDQPAWVRKRGRKGKALRRTARGGRKAARRSSRSSARGTRRSARKSSRSTNRTDYRRYLAARSETYGPVPFETQPSWVRRRGRKGKALLGRKKARRALARSTRSTGRKASRRGGATLTRRARKALNRQAFRAQKSSRRGGSKRSRSAARSSKRRSGSTSRKMTRASRRSLRKSSRGAAKVLTYSSLMSQLRKKPKLKAWVCVGSKRTGCGGGRKGRRGSRQMGVLRP